MLRPILRAPKPMECPATRQWRAGCTRAITAASIKEHVRLRQHQWRSMYAYVSINREHVRVRQHQWRVRIEQGCKPERRDLGYWCCRPSPTVREGGGVHVNVFSSTSFNAGGMDYILLTVTMPTHRPPDPHVLYAIAIDPSALKIGLPGFVELNVTTSYLIVQGLCSSRAVRFMVQQYASSRGSTRSCQYESRQYESYRTRSCRDSVR